MDLYQTDLFLKQVRLSPQSLKIYSEYYLEAYEIGFPPYFWLNLYASFSVDMFQDWFQLYHSIHYLLTLSMLLPGNCL